jgi:hypothetical protein
MSVTLKKKKGEGLIIDIDMRNDIYTPINLHTHKFVFCSIVFDCSPSCMRGFSFYPHVENIFLTASFH